MDAGDVFFKNLNVARSKNEKLISRAKVIVDAYNAMDCRVLNVGVNDLGAGIEFIQSIEEQANFPLISANIMSASTGKQLFPSHTIIKSHDLKIGFVGVTTGDSKLTDYTFSNPIESANKAIAAIKDKVDLIVLFANVSDVMETKLTQSVKNVDFLVRSRTRSFYRTPKAQNGVIVIRAGAQGKYAGILKIRKQDSESMLMDISKEQARIKFADNRLKSMSKNLKEGETLEQHYANDKSRSTLITRLQAEKQRGKELIASQKNIYYFDPVALNDKIADTPEVAEIVSEYMPAEKGH